MATTATNVAATIDVRSSATDTNTNTDTDSGHGNEKRTMNDKRNKKDELQQLLINLKILKGWPHDIITLVVDYVIDTQRLLLLMGITHPPLSGLYGDATVTIWSLSTELFYHIHKSLSTELFYHIHKLGNKSKNSNTNSSTSSCNDEYVMKWLRHDAHPQFRIPNSQFHSVVPMYDYDNERIIVTDGDTNFFINWNGIQHMNNTITSGSSRHHSLTPVPLPRSGMLHSLLSGDRSHECILIGGHRVSRKVEVYNMKTDKWSSLPDLTNDWIERSSLTSACSVDPRTNRIYIFGGGRHDYDIITAYNTVDYYDPITKTWDTLSVKMKRKRYGPAAIWLPTINCFLITGGYPTTDHGDSGQTYDEDDYDPIDGHLYEYEEYRSMEIYSPETNTFTLLPSSWSIPPVPHFRDHHLHLVDNRFLIIIWHSVRTIPPPGTRAHLSIVIAYNANVPMYQCMLIISFFAGSVLWIGWVAIILRPSISWSHS
jgi:hypothetical protein